MHQNIHSHRRVPRGALVMLERSAAKVARCVLRGERSREAPDLPGASLYTVRPRVTLKLIISVNIRIRTYARYSICVRNACLITSGDQNQPRAFDCWYAAHTV